MQTTFISRLCPGSRFQQALAAVWILATVFVLAPSARGQTCAPVPPNLVSWWDGDSVAGMIASDIQGSNHGSLFGGVTLVPGLVGQAFSLDGLDDGIGVGLDPSLDVAGGDHSVSVWARWTQVSGNARTIINLGAFGQRFMLSTGFNSPGQDNVSYGYAATAATGGASGTWYYNAGSGLNNGQWHHIAATRMGSTVTIYVDGASTGYGVGTVGFLNQNVIGRGYHGNFNGDIDELAIWNRALTAAEVAAIFAASSAGKCKFVDAPPVASAGADFSVDEGQMAVALDGSASSDPDGDTLTYAWSQVPGGTAVTLSDATAQQPIFDAPLVAIGGETLSFELLVTANGASSTDTVSVTVVNVNHPPVADAGCDQTTAEGCPVTLHGEDSFDIDSDPFSYTWVQVGGSPTVLLGDASTANPNFTAPFVGSGGSPGVVATLEFELTVDDGFSPDAPAPGYALANVMDNVTVDITNVNNAPVAAAGSDQTVSENTGVSLSGTLSSDPDNDALTYAWSQVGAITVILADPCTPSPSFTSPFVGAGGEDLTFELTVNDGYGGSATDTLVVHVQNINDPPLVSAAEPTVASLWPPNHGLVSVGIVGVSDPDDNATITIDSVTQDEPINGQGDGDTAIDAFINPDGTVLLRAERAGNGNGRVYHIHFTATDLEGSASGVVTVSVPHKKKIAAVDEGELYDSTN